MISFIKKIDIFSQMNDSELAFLAENAVSKSYELGDPILNVGELSQGIYVVKSGKARLFAIQDTKEVHIDSYESSDSFGESSIFHHPKMEYSVRASDQTEILLFPKEIILNLMAKNEALKLYIQRHAAIKIVGCYLNHVFHLRPKIDKTTLQHIAETVTIRCVDAGEIILTQDSAECRDLFLIRSGEVSLFLDTNDRLYELTVLGKDEFFGEKACVTYSVQAATAIANQDTVLLAIPQKTVHHMLSFQPDLQKRFEQRIQWLNDVLVQKMEFANRTPKRLLIDTWSTPKWKERIIKRFQLVEQAEERDCGAACLAMICKYYDIPVSLGQLREKAIVSAEGATMDSLAKTAESLGFVVKGITCSFSALKNIELPFIAHWKGYHFITVYGISKNYVWVADPGTGFQKMKVHEFERGWTGNCLVFSPTNHLIQSEPTSSPWLRFYRFLEPFKKNLIDLLLTALLIQFLGIAPPIIIQNILDRVVVHQSLDFLNILIVGLIITLAFSHITSLINAWMMCFLVRRLDFTMISYFYKHVLSLPIDFFTKRKTGDIIARFHENNKVRRFMTEGSISTVLNTLMLFTYFIVMFLYNIRLTLMLIAFLPPMILLLLIATPKYKDYARKTFFAGADAQSLLVETLGNAEIVKGMGIERSVRLKWERQYAKLLHLRYRAELFTVIIGVISSIFRSFTYVVLLWVGSRMVLSQELTIGQLMAFHVLIGSVMTPIMGLVRVWDELQETLVAMERLGDIFDIVPENQKTATSFSGKRTVTDRILLPEIAGSFRFENVYFRYGEQEPYILKKINLTIPAGEMIGIVGKSGSGKSTLAKLLMGFYPPTQGRIYLDDYDFSLVDMESYRAYTGYVMQTNSLFSGTISENIALGAQDPDIRKIIEVASYADADRFIRNLPSGYDQVVGERGIGLSQGQIQRICIARSLYRQPKILILDEATAALDSKTEMLIQKNLQKYFSGKTTIIISHRLSTIRNASKIYVLDHGTIVEHGTHEELSQKKGLYYYMFQDQLQDTNS